MPVKDYYRILDSDPSASEQEIKRAYRKLVLKYHPDRNPANPFAENYFKEIQEAYETLSHPEKRRIYNQDRWLHNGNFKNQFKNSTPESIVIESRKLRDHTGKIDIFRMDHESLHNHLMFVLSDSHLSILMTSGDKKAITEIARNTLYAMTNLKFRLVKEPVEKLLALTTNQSGLTEEINYFIRDRSKKETLQRIKPIIVLLVTLLLCVFIFLAAKD